MTEAFMRKKWLQIFAACGLALTFLTLPVWAQVSPAPGIVHTISDGKSFEVHYTAAFSVEDLFFGKLAGYDTVRFMDGNPLVEPGKPMLPGCYVRIALPEGMAVTGIKIVQTETEKIPGKFQVFPAQPPWPVSRPFFEDDFVKPDPSVYASTTAFPAQQAEHLHQTDLYGQNMAVISIFPVSYVPAAGELSLATSMEIVIDGVHGYECGDYLPASTTASERSAYEETVRDMVVNQDDVMLREQSNPSALLGVGPGDYDYVVVVPFGWSSYWNDFVTWKNKKGVPTNIVDLTWIYSNYSGSNNQYKIREFVKDARNTWGTNYFLLAGDSGLVPYHTKYILGDDIPNDTYYSDYDGDYTCEVHVGRASVTSIGDINVFTDKVLTYEKDPPLSNYAKTAFFMGFDLYTWGSGEGEDCKAAINSLYLPGGWTYRREYDSESGSHESDCKNYLNQGNNLVNHIDHSGTDSMGVGSTNHGDSLSTGEMQALTNGDRQSILYSIGCWPCDFPDPTCIAEGFVRNSNGGGVAFVGNTRYGWYQPFEGDYASLRYDRYFFRSLFDQNHYRLGDCYSDHKNDSPVSDDYYKYIFTELTLLGDPDLPIWTENPTSLTATHDTTLPVGQSTTFDVTVLSGGSPVNGATVCLWKNGDIFETGQTNYTGVVSFYVNPASQGTMYVTATMRNKLPYEGQATVEQSTVTYNLTVTSQLDGAPFSGALFSASPPDNGGHSMCTTPFTLTYDEDTTVTLGASSNYNMQPFMRWIADGAGQPRGDRSVQVVMDHNMTAQINYTKYGLIADKYTFSVDGDTVDFTLTAGSGNAYINYIVLGSLSGTEPGMTLPGGSNLPLNWDGYSKLIYNLANSPLCVDFLGVLDGAGEGSAQLNCGAVSPAYMGTIMYYAFCQYAPYGFVSNPIEIQLVE